MQISVLEGVSFSISVFDSENIKITSINVSASPDINVSVQYGGSVGVATDSTYGIVKLSNTIDDNEDTVPKTKAVNDAIKNSGTKNYDDLSNKPSINNVSLSGNKTLSEIGAMSKDTPISQLEGYPQTPTYNAYLRDDGSFSQIVSGSGGYASNVYFTNVDSDILTFKKLSYSPSIGVDGFITGTSSNGSLVTIGKFIYDLPIGISTIDAGSWIFNYSCNVSSIDGDSNIVTDVFKRSISGVETVLFTVESKSIDNLVSDYVKTEIIKDIISVNPTDRIGIIIKFKSSNSTDITVKVNITGNNISYFNTPLALRHSQLRSPNEDINIQHLTNAEKMQGALATGVVNPSPISNKDLSTVNKVANEVDSVLNEKKYTIDDYVISTGIKGYYYVAGNGRKEIYSDGYIDETYYEVRDTFDFYYTGKSQYAAAWVVFYDINKTVISTSPASYNSTSNNLTNYKIIPPANCKFVRFSSIYINFSVKIRLIQKTNNNIFGKKIAFIGDSITAGAAGVTPSFGGWVKLIGDKNLMSYSNFGVSGTSITKVDGRSDSICERIETYSDDFDYICLQGGVNDIVRVADKFGAVSNGYEATLDLYTFCGAVEYLCKYSLLKWANKKVCFLITYTIGTPSWISWSDKMEEIFKKWGMPYFDLRKNAGFNLSNTNLRSLYGVDLGGGNYDSWHCNVNAYKLLAPKIEAFLQAL